MAIRHKFLSDTLHVRKVAFWGWMAWLLAYHLPSWAQLGEDISRGFKGQETQELELFEPVKQKEGVIPVLPTAPILEQNADRLSTAPSVYVKAIRLAGNTVLNEVEIRELIKPYVGRVITSEDLQQLRQTLSLRYLQQGYVNSGVTIPDQQVQDGIIRLRVIEGNLTKIELTGNDDLRDRYVTGRITRNLHDTLNIKELQDALKLMQQDPLIDQLNAQLTPGTRLGESILNVKIQEATPYAFSLTADNHRSPSVGAERGTLSFMHQNLTGNGDRFSLSGSYSDGLEDGSVAYSIPLNRWDSTLSVFYEVGESIVVEEPFDDIDIESETDSASLTVSHPLINTLNTKLELSLGLRKSHSETTLLGQPFSFSLGAQDGESDSTVLSAGAELVRRNGNQVIALRGTVRQGIDALGATIIEGDDMKIDPGTGAEIPDGKFTLFLGQIQYARRLNFQLSQLLARVNYQQAFDPLLSVEKFAVGGAKTVRGYRENQFVRDSGVTASLEWHVPLWVDDNGVDTGPLKLVPFIDYGRSWSEDDELPTHDGNDISSIGLGLIWEPADWFNAELFYGQALNDDDIPEPADDNLQDSGVHFALSLRWPFG